MGGHMVWFLVSMSSDKAAGWTVQVSNPGRGKSFFSFPKHPGQLRSPPSILFCGYQGRFSGSKKVVALSSTSPHSAEVKTGWSYTSVPPSAFMEWTGKTIFFYPFLISILDINLLSDHT
jgi:hypothetical protein